MDKQIELTKMQNDEDKILIAKVVDKIKFVESRNRFESTDFLDLRQQGIVKEILDKRKHDCNVFVGGYEEAERKIVIFYPDNIDKEYVKEKLIEQF